MGHLQKCTEAAEIVSKKTKAMLTRACTIFKQYLVI